MPKAILLDLDDTIIAWDAVSEKSWQRVCREFAPSVAGLEAEILFTAINGARDWYWNDPERHRQGRLNLRVARREVVSLAFNRLGITDSKVPKQLADACSVERERAAALCPGAIDTLRHFRNDGLKLALVSNGSSEVQRRKIKRFRLAPFFNYIIIEGEFGFGKPDERLFLHTLEQLSITSKEAWMIGDDLERDVAAAQRLKIFSIWVDWRGTGLPEPTSIRPDRIIRALSELL